ncbi:ATP-binding protein [Streptomyces lydicus]|uniref:ATP-binding protein n=1 Tax=Streptomyces lydicus TaxID=47763 RepID=UPI0036E8CEEB
MSTVEAERRTVRKSFRLSVPNGETAPKIARDLVAYLLILTGHSFAVDSARLLVSEVVTNVYQHTTTLIVHIDVSVRPEHVIVAVWDNKPEVRPTVLYARAEQEGGRGLRLVKEVSTAWGVSWPAEPDTRGKRVWFSLAYASPEGAVA